MSAQHPSLSPSLVSGDDHDHQYGHEHGGHGRDQHSGHGHHKECNNCEDKSCGATNTKSTLSQMISRSKAANLARINVLQAVENGDLPLVHYLLTRANPMAQGMRDSDGNTPIHISAKAGHVDLILYFVEKGFPIDLVNSLGHTPLMLAVSYGRIPAINAMLKLGADANKKDNLGFSPIIHAAQFGNVFNFHHLVSNAEVDINDMDNDGHSVLCWACYNGHKELLEYLLSDNCPMVPHLGVLDQMHRTPMHWAASQNAREMCSFLVKCKCKLCPSSEITGESGTRDENGKSGNMCPTGRQMLNVRDEDGKTPADCANAKGHASLAQELEYERNGVRVAVVAPTPKKDDEKIYQFLSAFLPLVCIIFLGMPYLPYWALVICCVATVAVHVSGRVVRWSSKSRTLVPQGILAAILLGMVWCLVDMHYPLFTNLIMVTLITGFEYNYYIIMYVDPGAIVSNEGSYKRILDTVASGAEPPTEYCRACNVVKPSRSKHCRECNICVDRFDHHCYWIAGCVGKKNVWRFYVLLLQCIFTILIYLYLTFTFLRYSVVTNSTAITLFEGLAHVYTVHPQVLWMSVFLIIVLVPVTALASFHTNLIGKDATTFETMTRFSRSPGLQAKPFSVGRVLAFLQRGEVVFVTGSSPPP